MTLVIELSDPERRLLMCGVNEWGGPASCTDELALAMGFRDRNDLHAESPRLRDALKGGQPLPAGDWARILVMTEFVFISNVFGSGLDWPITTGIPDAEAVVLLRDLQRRFGKAGASRTHFGPSTHQEHQHQAQAATAIRLFRAGRTDLVQLLASIDGTVQHFGSDLDHLSKLRDQLATVAQREELEDADQREIALAEVDAAIERFRQDPTAGRRRLWF